MRFLVLAATLVIATGTARAQTAQCQVTEILATNDKKGVDAKLDRYKAKLTKAPFSAWDSFELLGEQGVAAERSKPASARLQGGTLTLLFKDKMAAQAGKTRLRFGVDLDNQKGRRAVSTVVVFDSGDPLLIAGEPYKNGTYILALVCNSP